MPVRLAGYPSVSLSLLLTLAGQAGAQSFPRPPSPEEAAEAAALVSAMKTEERGPYLRIRWFCADGTVQPPQGQGCLERGGGVQHAEPNPAALRLAELGYHVGTILQATSYDQFVDLAHAGYRLRELALERYLVEADDGWVLRRARYYRGASQAEDEEAAGRVLLETLLSDSAWIRAEYFLATRLAVVLPHTRPGQERTTDRVRTLATEIAELDEGFMRIRVKIHSMPSPQDLTAVEAYLGRAGLSPETRARLESLREALEAQYDERRTLASLDAYARRLRPDFQDQLSRLRQAVGGGDPADEWAALVQMAPQVRAAAESARGGRRRLDLLDLGVSLQDRAFALAQELAPPGSRRDVIRRTLELTDVAYAGGYLSGRERAALREAAVEVTGRGEIGALEYKRAVGYLSRSLDWTRSTVRGTFQPVLDRYVPVEPKSAGFSDAILRGSVLLPLSRLLDRLEADADAELGATHVVLGQATARGIRGLNPGVALRPLHILEAGEEDDVDANTIYVLPETPPELKPVAGVLTLAEGNLLSHVQLLARNLGIPNATVAPELRSRLEEAEGREVFYAVTPLGRVILEWPENLDADEAALLNRGGPVRQERYRLQTTRLDLDRTDPIPLAQLRAVHSGVVVGPKAANLGQLAADFPGRVSGAVALPFGMFVRHVGRPYQGSSGTVMEELRGAYARGAEMRAEGASKAEVDAFMLRRLAWVREAIEGLPWIPEVRAQVTEALLEAVDGDVGRGVFVRSDTNVEDLPQFSGAGLNLTVAHQTSLDDVLASVKRVWTSPFTERAYLWRSEILEEQGDVYPSVLLQLSVPSEHSGVLITSGLQEGGDGALTVVVAEGVGGAVEGEDAETLLVDSDGIVHLLSQAKAPWRRELQRGGTRWVAAMRPDTLLRPAELAQLQDVVAAWKGKWRGTPEESTVWDMEFGFTQGRLWLFQVRPFVRHRNSDLYLKLQALDRQAMANTDRQVSLVAPPGGDP